MKTMTKIIVSLLTVMFFMVYGPQTFAQKKLETTRINAKVDCNDCKEKIEHHLAFEKGVKDVDADVATKVVTVKYDPKKTTPEKLAQEITKIGYEGKVAKDDCKGVKKNCASKCSDKKGKAKSSCKKSCKKSSCSGKAKRPCCSDKKK